MHDKAIQYYIKKILENLNQDVEREGLIDTPNRYAKYLQEFLKPVEFNMTTFKSETDEMVIVKDIDFSSLCEHHLLPFIGKGHIAYVPKEKMVGISKLPRTLEMFSKRLQNQERITSQVANYLQEHLDALGVAVVLQATHTCMTIRGVQKPNTITMTSCMLGVFKDNANCRNEFLNLIK